MKTKQTVINVRITKARSLEMLKIQLTQIKSNFGLKLFLTKSTL